MNFLGRPLMRNMAFRTNIMRMRTLGRVEATRMPSRLTGLMLLTRSVASSVSGKPGSQTLEHAATNIKEEVGNSAADLAKVIAACNATRDAVSPTGAESFVRVHPEQRVGSNMTAAIEAWNHAAGPVRCAAAYDGSGTRRCVIVC